MESDIFQELLVQERDAIEKAQTPHKPQIKRMPNVSSRVTEEALSGAWQVSVLLYCDRDKSCFPWEIT